MKYPTVCNWVSYREGHGIYTVYDEAFDETYKMSPQEFGFFRRLDGKTDPYKIQTDLTREQRQRMLTRLEQNMLIRKSRILSLSPGSILITLFSIKNGGASKKKTAAVADRLLSVLWLPVLLTSVLYLFKHYEEVTGPECMISGSVFGLIIGMVLHEAAHAAACLHYGKGRVFEFGVGFNVFPCAYVLLNMNDIKSRTQRAHVNAAGIEMNLLLTGIGLYLACFFKGVGVFFFFAGIQNGVLALLNLISIKDIDGMAIVSEYLGVSDFLGYAKKIAMDRRKRQKLCCSGINGLITIAACYIALFMQCGLPLLVALNLAFLVL